MVKQKSGILKNHKNTPKNHKNTPKKALKTTKTHPNFKNQEKTQKAKSPILSHFLKSENLIKIKNHKNTPKLTD